MSSAWWDDLYPAWLQMLLTALARSGLNTLYRIYDALSLYIYIDNGANITATSYTTSFKRQLRQCSSACQQQLGTAVGLAVLNVASRLMFSARSQPRLKPILEFHLFRVTDSRPILYRQAAYSLCWIVPTLFSLAHFISLSGSRKFSCPFAVMT